MAATSAQAKSSEVSANGHYRLRYFTDLMRRPVCAGTIQHRLGRLTDIVFQVAEPYPEALGLYLEHGWGKPTEFIPWDKVLKIDNDAIFVAALGDGQSYPPFVDQPGWILVEKHLMGRTILDIDGRRTEVVNDVRLLEARGRLALVDVDVSFNGFLRRWGFGRRNWAQERLISWKHVQPLSLEDAVPTDRVQLSVTREQLAELPEEDLADALEELSGQEQEALFLALEPEKAADTLVEAEPRAQRQILSNLSKEQAREILEEMSVPEIANLFSSLSHQRMTELTELLSADRANAVSHILSEQEAHAGELISGEYLALPEEALAGQVLTRIRQSSLDPKNISYIYVVEPIERVLRGVVDLRELVLARDEVPLGELMTSPVVSADQHDGRDKLAEMFEKYDYRMIPVVDAGDHILGVVRHKDVMMNPEIRVREHSDV
ncbi:MAG: magnesium transporter MgtE N-terminal domain-containing protein [Bacteroidales bacterium]